MSMPCVSSSPRPTSAKSRDPGPAASRLCSGCAHSWHGSYDLEVGARVCSRPALQPLPHQPKEGRSQRSCGHDRTAAKVYKGLAARFENFMDETGMQDLRVSLSTPPSRRVTAASQLNVRASVLTPSNALLYLPVPTLRAGASRREWAGSSSPFAARSRARPQRASRRRRVDNSDLGASAARCGRAYDVIDREPKDDIIISRGTTPTHSSRPNLGSAFATDPVKRACYIVCVITQADNEHTLWLQPRPHWFVDVFLKELADYANATELFKPTPEAMAPMGAGQVDQPNAMPEELSRFWSAPEEP
ncbi:hypothetical protein GGF50DRAFT_119867 [Schizophyllum commune]